MISINSTRARKKSKRLVACFSGLKTSSVSSIMLKTNLRYLTDQSGKLLYMCANNAAAAGFSEKILKTICL